VNSNHDFRKESIITRAALLISQSGMEAFTIKALAERLGMGSSGILYHFKNKSAIFEAVIMKVVTDGREIVETRLNQNSEKGFPAIRVWIEAHYAWLELAPYRKSLLLIFYAQSLRSPDLSQINAAVVSRGVERIHEILRQAQSAGSLGPFDSKSKAVQLHSMLTGQLLKFCSLGEDASYNRESTIALAKLLLATH